jgi:arylsulfatase
LSNKTDKIKRDVLPIPDQACEGLITFDAKDPDAAFPPIEPLRPPAGAPERPRRPPR